MPAEWSSQSDGPTRTYKREKSGANQARIKNPRFYNPTLEFEARGGNRVAVRMDARAGSRQLRSNQESSRRLPPVADGKQERGEHARTFHGEKRESCLVRGQSSRFSLAAATAGIARPPLPSVLPGSVCQVGSAPPPVASPPGEGLSSFENRG